MAVTAKELILGQKVRLTVLKDITVCQATKTPSKEFKLEPERQVVGTFVERTYKGDHCFNIPEFEDEVFFPSKSIVVAEELDKDA